jgi:hypothetical protein
LGTDGPKTPFEATPDPAVRSNQVFAVYFGLLSGERARTILETVRTRILVPGALRSLARPLWEYNTGVATPIRRLTAEEAKSAQRWPFAWYHPHYEKDAGPEVRDRNTTTAPDGAGCIPIIG